MKEREEENLKHYHIKQHASKQSMGPKRSLKVN